MRTVFADAFYFFALVNRADPAHARATAFTQGYTGRTVMTGWVMTEVADSLAKTSQRRALFLGMLADLRANPDALIVPTTDQLLQDGIDLYAQRPDKEWSLTDCISLVVMQREGITEALTGDHHFTRAGFIALLQ